MLETAGIFLLENPNEAILSDDCKKLCTSSLAGEYNIPVDSLFQEDYSRPTLNNVRSNNQARVVRDIMPTIVPSAELLYTRGVKNLEHLAEEVNEEWTKCSSLAGPRPKPDLQLGCHYSASPVMRGCSWSFMLHQPVRLCSREIFIFHSSCAR